MIAETAELEEEFARELIERLPPTMRVGAYDFRLIPVRGNVASSSGDRGAMSSQCQEIRFKEDLPTRYEAVEVVLHELMHALWWVSDLEDKPEEEHAVAMFGMNLMGVFRDNPWLIHWIQSAEL
jgi:hypothetical protein